MLFRSLNNMRLSTTMRMLKYLPLILIMFLIALPGCKERKESDRITIRFVSWKPNQPEVWKEILGIFEKENPDIRVIREIGPHSSTAFHDLLTQKLKNKSRDVDVFFMDVIWPPEFAAAGWALPLDGMFPQSERRKFLDGTIKIGRASCRERV